MKKAIVCVIALALSTTLWAMPLGSSARTAIPSDIQQIISVDYAEAFVQHRSHGYPKNDLLHELLKHR